MSKEDELPETARLASEVLKKAGVRTEAFASVQDIKTEDIERLRREAEEAEKRKKIKG